MWWSDVDGSFFYEISIKPISEINIHINENENEKKTYIYIYLKRFLEKKKLIYTSDF